MDDLRMLRDLGRDLEHEPPPTLARQRSRLLAGRRRRPRRRAALVGLVAVLTAALLAAPVLLLRAERSSQEPLTERTQRPGTALNILIIGSDRRRGDPVGARADTIVLLHLPAGRKPVTAVSIPRDSAVRIGPCKPGAATRTDRIGAALAEGGPGCVRKAVETAAKVKIDHHAVVDFAGLKRMVDALGGVEITLPRAMADRQSGLSVPAGRQILDGDQALAYIRARREVGDGSDLDRIRRQQQFMKALARRAGERLSSPDWLAAFLRMAAGAVDSDLGFREMHALARSPGRAGLNDLVLATVPVAPDRTDPNRVVWHPARADRLFAPFRH
ncbi:hypothetical protein DPM19_13910 [Actinomadura craniellae]|uniref:Cell envelope-related transcriptional attenuator domain-containing protein n=1 Tax=Actinomadura craniellae TaxID=2231787 RepID=A0A365H6V4_9ACTN|nr:LCP family protein [Actinomadura craniellae]RAY14817.1 hypothetical protein DPM19_13910 [Actinomadura craniellae]